MKTCEKCGEDFIPRGRQRVCRECKNGVQERVQEAEETKPTRPAERFSRMVFGGGGVMFRR